MNLVEVGVIRKQFEYYRMLADKTILLLSEEQLNWRYNEESNSVAMLMRHIAGNLTSRFTNFFTEDGEKKWRNRDDEFRVGYFDRHQLITDWDKAWAILFELLDHINGQNIAYQVKIRNQEHTVAEALYRQLGHYSYHIGQMIYIGKMLFDKDWKSLSIPKNQSQNYNAQKFSNPNSEKHFTDDYLRNR